MLRGLGHFGRYWGLNWLREALWRGFQSGMDGGHRLRDYVYRSIDSA